MGGTLQTIAGYLMPEHAVTGVIITFILVVAVSYGFELYSLITKKGHYEILDAVAAIVGGIIGMGVILLVKYVY